MCLAIVDAGTAVGLGVALVALVRRGNSDDVKTTSQKDSVGSSHGEGS